MKAHWETFWTTQAIKRELRPVIRMEPGADVLARIQAELGDIQPVTLPVHRPRLMGRMVAVAAVVPLLIVVASAATLFPQTEEGAQQWIEKRWTEQTTAGMQSGATSGISGSPMGVTGFDAKKQVTWSMHGIAHVDIHIKGGSGAGGATTSLTNDLQLRLARVMSPAIATTLRKFQEQHQDDPETTITLNGKSQQWHGFGHFEVRGATGDVLVSADVTPID